MKTLTPNTLRFTGALVALFALTGCGTLQPITAKTQLKLDRTAVASDAQEATPPAADAHQPNASSDVRELGTHSHIQDFVSRAGNTLRCGAQGTAFGALVPFHPKLLFASGGLSVFAIPVTAPLGGILGAVDGARGKCTAGSRTAAAVQTTSAKRQTERTRSAEPPQAIFAEGI